ncbi:MBL fold metallo-hydrolase [Thermogladius sp. 4427co]|uniref:MBL fold metallo-hydrolase n=1 Tax=Thermogladius sp. 4427co TaxID=3450718 RepID=UPI003F7A9CAE
MVEIIVLYDDTLESGENCVRDYGLSILVETGGKRLLFDTGSSPHVLEANAKRIGVSLSSIDLLVISNPQPDHTGGVQAVGNRSVPIYVPPVRQGEFLNWLRLLGFQSIRVVRDVEAVSESVILLSFPESRIPEVSLLVEDGEGYTMLVGCGYPGVHYMVGKAVGKKYNIVKLVGGLHLAEAGEAYVRAVAMELKRLGVEEILPLHCSGKTLAKYASLLGVRIRSSRLCSKTIL